MKILFCIADRREINETKINSEFRLSNIETSFYYIGIGAKNIGKLREKLSTGKYDLIVNPGTAGILNDKLKVFDTVIPHKYISIKDNKLKSIDTPLSILDEMREKKWVTASVLTTDKPVTKEYTKHQLREKSFADIVDMESYHLAKLSHEYDIPFISVKVLTDRADFNATSDWSRNIDVAREVLTDAVLELLKQINKI